MDEIGELANRYGTPFYLYDADRIGDRMRQVREAFEDRVRVYYAVKSNPNLELLRTIRASADGLDISSGGELDQALLAGYDPAAISFAGPAKSSSELTAAIENGVGCISVESHLELDLCAAIAERTGRRARVLLRINPELTVRSFGLKMGGKAVQFGVEESELDGVLEAVLAHQEHVSFEGIHVYAGSQCFDADGVAEGVENTLRIARNIEAESQLVCRTVNLGGGFGVSHADDDRELDLDALGSRLGPAIREFHGLGDRRIVFELGRYLTAAAGIYVARVVRAKDSRGKRFFMTDGGLHHHLAAAGSLGAGFRTNFPVRNLSRPDAPRTKCNITGPSCNPTDLLGMEIELPEPQIGDLIGVLKSGAYGLTASPILFLGHPTPAELVKSGGAVSLARPRMTIHEFNGPQRPDRNAGD